MGTLLIGLILFVAAGIYFTDGARARHKKRINQKYYDQYKNTRIKQ